MRQAVNQTHPVSTSVSLFMPDIESSALTRRVGAVARNLKRSECSVSQKYEYGPFPAHIAGCMW